jgi:pyridoxal phosphate enzyme (YggS family)
MLIADALKEVKAKIHNYAVKAGRDSDNIKLIAVSKTVDLHRIIEALNAGVRILGENKAQEAIAKITELGILDTALRAEWHLIGSLQKNKAKKAVQLFDLIHSVDSSGLAEEINKHALILGKRQRVLVQVKLSDEESKHGIPEKGLMGLLEKIVAMDNLKLEGLMTMPPFFHDPDPEQARPYFRRLRQLAEMASERGYSVNELSMGMSGDYRIAIEEGSTMVRIGTAIFGERPGRISAEMIS